MAFNATFNQNLTQPVGRIQIRHHHQVTCKGPSNPAHDEVYSIQHYVMEFVSDLRQICGFLWVLRFPPPIKLNATI
jgi:hypothetical protein